jgi:hypothetical protein
VLAPGAAARAGRVAAEAGMRSWQGRGGAGSPRSGPTPCPDGVLVGRGRRRAQRGASVVGGRRGAGEAGATPNPTFYGPRNKRPAGALL